MAYPPSTLLTQLVLAASATAHVALMFREGQWTRSSLNLSMVVFCAASLAVYLVAALQAHRRRAKRPVHDLTVALAFCGAGLGTILDAIFVNRGDQRGLVFLFIPPLQWLIYIVASLFRTRE